MTITTTGAQENIAQNVPENARAQNKLLQGFKYIVSTLIKCNADLVLETSHLGQITK